MRASRGIGAPHESPSRGLPLPVGAADARQCGYERRLRSALRVAQREQHPDVTSAAQSPARRRPRLTRTRSRCRTRKAIASACSSLLFSAPLFSVARRSTQFASSSALPVPALANQSSASSL